MSEKNLRDHGQTGEAIKLQGGDWVRLVIEARMDLFRADPGEDWQNCEFYAEAPLHVVGRIDDDFCDYACVDVVVWPKHHPAWAAGLCTCGGCSNREVRECRVLFTAPRSNEDGWLVERIDAAALQVEADRLLEEGRTDAVFVHEGAAYPRFYTGKKA